jgi:TonB-dependent starch-binding outer membrane protein SusC
MHKQLLLAALFLLNGALSALAQKTVTGKIADAQGEALIGVTVSVKGAGQGTITDINGAFSLRVNPSDVLVFSYTGMKTQEITVGDRTTLDLTMEDAGIAIEQVVVTGYTETYKQAFTGSAVAVSPAKIENAPRVSFQESLQGNVAGLFLTQGNGQPGANQQIRIRGVGSINGANDPLYVVDGIPLVAGDISRVNTTSNTIAGLNPNDIESINVLKDASATSLYGSRGANGVIIITTKQGKSGKPKLDVSMQTGIQEITYSEENRPLNTAEFVELLSEGLVNNGTIRFNNH